MSTHPLKPDIQELVSFFIGAQDALVDQLAPDDASSLADIIEQFARGLTSEDPDAQRDAWYEARQQLRRFSAYPVVDQQKRNFFDPATEKKLQTAEEVVPTLTAIVKKLREGKKTASDSKDEDAQRKK